MEKNKTNQFIHFCLLIFTFFIFGCSNDEVINNEVKNIPDNEVITIMSVSKNNITFGYLENTNSFLISNLSENAFDWNWTELNPSSNISANPNSGTLQPGSSIEVTLTLDRSNMITLIYNLIAKVNNNKGQSFTQIIEISNYTEDKWLIGGKVIDAEYDKVNDLLFVVSENPNQIRKFNLINNVEESLSLNNIPKCLSIIQGGNHAVVGHNGSFSYVNLTSMTIENTYPVSTDIFDIVLAPNNWAYITSSIAYEKIRGVDLSNGQETLSQNNQVGFSGSNRPNLKAKLHPSGNYIYTTNELIPSDIDKYDINNGIPQFLYDSQYHSDYDFGQKFWFSENGNKIYTTTKNIFSSSTIQNNDLIYLSSIPPLTGDNIKVIDIMDSSENSDRICALFINNPVNYALIASDKVRIYNTQFLYLREIEIPKHMTINSNGSVNFINSFGYFGFLNSIGTKFYVLVKYTNSNQWAIATINIT